MNNIILILLTFLTITSMMIMIIWIDKKMEDKFPFVRISNYQEWQDDMTKDLERGFANG